MPIGTYDWMLLKVTVKGTWCVLTGFDTDASKQFMSKPTRKRLKSYSYSYIYLPEVLQPSLPVLKLKNIIVILQ